MCVTPIMSHTHHIYMCGSYVWHVACHTHDVCMYVWICDTHVTHAAHCMCGYAAHVHIHTSRTTHLHIHTTCIYVDHMCYTMWRFTHITNHTHPHIQSRTTHIHTYSHEPHTSTHTYHEPHIPTHTVPHTWRGHTRHACGSVCGSHVCVAVCVDHMCDMMWWFTHMGWLRSVGSIKLQVSFEEYRLLYRALLQKRPIIISILLTEVTPCHDAHVSSYTVPHTWGVTHVMCVDTRHSCVCRVAVCCSVVQSGAVWCSVVQCGAVCHAAVCCHVLPCVAVCCSVLQCVAVCCSVLQCVAVCCRVWCGVGWW